MKTTKPVVILLVLVFLTTAGIHPVVAMEKPEISSTRTASCLVKITTHEAVMPLDEFVVDYLLRSSGVAGKAVREVLETSPDVASELFEIEEVYSNVFPDSAGGTGGMGIPPGTTVPGRRSTTPARTPSRPPTTRTARPRTPTRTPTRLYPTRPTTTRTPTVTQPLPSTTEQTILFRLYVDLSRADTEEPVKPVAEEFMAALIDNLRTALRGAFDDYHSKLDGQLKHAADEARRAEIDLVEMQAKLREISDSRDLSRTVILRDISSLRQRLQAAIMQRASDETLYEATAKQIAEEQVRRKKLVEDDPVVRELLSLTDAHEKRLKETQKFYEKGNASFATVYDLKEEIIKSRIDLAKRKEEISNPPGGIVLSSLNNEMANLSTNLALAQQEIRAFQVQLEEEKDRLLSAEKYELLSLKTDIARQGLEETLLWRARLGRNIRSIQPPDVTVIGAQ